jgi:hypothetical protein
MGHVQAILDIDSIAKAFLGFGDEILYTSLENKPVVEGAVMSKLGGWWPIMPGIDALLEIFGEVGILIEFLRWRHWYLDGNMMQVINPHGIYTMPIRLPKQ